MQLRSMMKAPFLVAGCIAIFCSGWCLGQGQKTTHLPGGGDWKALSFADHEFYLAGFVQGYGVGMLHAGSLTIAKLAPEKVSAMTSAEKNDYEESLARARQVAPVLLHSPSSSGLERTVSTFYSDYRNVSICFEDAILFSAASLAGNAAKDQELEVARKKGARIGCR